MFKSIKTIGFVLFYASFILFNSTLFLHNYTLTEKIVNQSDLKKMQKETLLQKGSKLFNVEMSKWKMASELKSLIEEVNNEFKAQEEHGQVIYSKNTVVYHLAKEASHGIVRKNNIIFLILTFGMGLLAALMIYLPNLALKHPDTRNHNLLYTSISGRGIMAYLLFFYLIGFYVILYFFPVYIIEPVLMVDPISLSLFGSYAGRWFLYGLLYTVFVIIMGVRFMVNYRNSRYHLTRTVSVMFFQLVFAFMLPNLMVMFNYPYMDLKNIWPLNYTFFYEYRIEGFLNAGAIGMTMFLWGIILIIAGVPLITFFWGKRWYCSWVCGCGGLAETAGDPFRHQSNKSLKAWQFERVSVHSVLLLAIGMTAVVLYSYLSGDDQVLGLKSYNVQKFYGFLVGSVLAGVVGTGFYPIFGNRVWCRFFCPLAAYIGIIQRFKSRFRITTNGGQCISCGNCSKYCEMGIDVRFYAQKGQNIVRASCVGCGICSAVCPRGVLRLENRDTKNRVKKNPVLTGNLNNKK